jgi:hypothetical protein
MELLCPHCMKKVTVADDKSGQVLNCPLCQGVFAAPSLPPPPVRPSPPPPLSAPPPQVMPPPMETAVQPVSAVPASPITPPPPPRSPSDYSRRYALRLRPDVLVCVPPPCVFLIIFVFSFFPWHAVIDALNAPPPLSLWELAFSERGTGLFLAYTLLTILVTLPVSIACAVLELRLVPVPPHLAQQLTPLMPWKSGITFAMLALTFLMIAYDYQQGILAMSAGSSIVLGEKIAFRLHFLALVASGLELWVQSRVARYLPLPRFSMRL